MSEMMRRSFFVAVIALAAAAVAMAVPPFEPGYEKEMEQIERANQQREIDWSPVNHAQMERLIAAVERIASAMEKPVRPLYIWEKSKCEWCGSTILESGEKVRDQDKPVVWNITTLYGGPVEVTDEKNKRIVLEMCVPDAKLKAKEIAKDRNLKVIFQEHCETPDGLE